MVEENTMSAQEKRQLIIRENIVELIRYLTIFELDEENFKRCERFAWYTFKNQKHLSVNSHEVKRKIDGMQEKFIVGNYSECADYLKKLCTDLINNPLCLNHYEIDVQWAILDFLFCLSYNPVGSIKRKNLKIPLTKTKDTKQASDEELKVLANLLKEDFIRLDRENDEEQTDLSEWSDSEKENYVSGKKSKSENISLGKCSDKVLQTVSTPKKCQSYQTFSEENCAHWLVKNVENAWWSDTNWNCKVKSSYESAHFCVFWHEYLKQNPNNLIKFEKVSTVTEYCLLREIIWMFQYPTTNKFFSVEGDNIFIRENASISSVSLQNFSLSLKTIIPYIKMASCLQKFINSVYYYDDIAPPKVYEYYASSLKEILQLFHNHLLKQEQKIQRQSAFEVNTLIQFLVEMRSSFMELEKIYDIHSFVALDFKMNPAHICSAHLLSGLLYKFTIATCHITSSIAISLFLSSVKVFCNIIDLWWIEGRLDDLRNEFLVERASDESEDVCARLYTKCKEKSFFVSNEISNVIHKNAFIKLLMEHSLEAGCILNLLCQINKVGDLKNASLFERSFYDIFLEEVYKNVKNFHSEELLDNKSEAEKCQQLFENNDKEKIIAHNPVNSFSFEDKLLLMIFDNNGKEENCEMPQDVSVSKQEIFINSSALDIFKWLNKTSKLIVPIEEIIVKCMSQISKSRISYANNFVMTMYREEFEILKHLHNMKRVLLLEASDLMHIFYTKLFLQIESGKSWANPFYLTVQLDDILCSRFPDMSSLFKIEINSLFKCQTNNVTEAVDEIVVKYDVKKELQNIITQKIVEDYNKVFRVLLKVKWGLWTLENLQFSAIHKKYSPFAEFTMTDLLVRRLQQLRFWLIYAIQNVHFHLTIHVLQSMGEQLDIKIQNCENLIEMKFVHESYIQKLCEFSFTEKSSANIKCGIEQLLNLVKVLKLEWQSFENVIENSSIDESDCSLENNFNYNLNLEIEAIERTYIRCHEYLAKTLTNEVYVIQNTHLSGLSAAFNTSMPR